MNIRSAKRRHADKHPLENPLDLTLMIAFFSVVPFVTVLVWAAQ